MFSSKALINTISDPLLKGYFLQKVQRLAYSYTKMLRRFCVFNSSRQVRQPKTNNETTVTSRLRSCIECWLWVNIFWVFEVAGHVHNCYGMQPRSGLFNKVMQAIACPLYVFHFNHFFGREWLIKSLQWCICQGWKWKPSKMKNGGSSDTETKTSLLKQK